MTFTISPELEAAVRERARRQGITAQDLIESLLREKLTEPSPPPIEPRDEWERRLLAIGRDCGVSLPNSAVSSEGLYD